MKLNIEAYRNTDMFGCMCLLEEAFKNDCKQIASDIEVDRFKYFDRIEYHWLGNYADEYSLLEKKVRYYRWINNISGGENEEPK